MLSLNAHRVLAYSLLSFTAVTLTILSALRSYSNFYSVAIYLSKSSRSVLVLANFGFIVALLCGHLVQRLFFGSLRPTEVERLYDRLWFFITESLLAFTIFRDEFDASFALMFGFLLFIKSFHWLASDRIEWMDQVPYPGPPLLFHIRMSTLFVIMWIADFVMFLIAAESTLTHGVGGMVLFASEYGILIASIMNTISKYLLSVYDLRRAGRRGGENAPAWEDKSMWIFYIELATDFLKLTTYLIFFLIIIAFYGLPLNIIRDVYITARSFITRLRALHRYQTATRNMDQRYPNATEEELRTMNDRTCIICREEMVAHDPTNPVVREGPNLTPKKLPCGHVFHFYCLRSWLERQQSCPTCRRTVLETNAGTPHSAPAQAQGPGGNPRPGNAGAAPVGNGIHGQRNMQGRIPLGLLGRLFAPAMPAANNPEQGANPVNVRMPQEVLIQYHIQYQRQQPQAQPPEHLRPVPQFRGFNRPGGGWQPWPGNAGVANDQRNADPAAQGPVGTAERTPGASMPQNPREAAAAAALRRLDGRSSGQTHASNSSPSTEERTNTERTTLLPALIPLYDLNNSATHGPNTVGQETQFSSATGSDAGGLNSRLTEEQLAVMDRLTREAIDERLRVLEGVSISINQCIDDLMRMRSALPPRMPQPHQSRQTTSLNPEVPLPARAPAGVNNPDYGDDVESESNSIGHDGEDVHPGSSGGSGSNEGVAVQANV